MSLRDEPLATAATIAQAAHAWIAGDPDPQTQAELSAIAAGGDGVELAARMTPLEFGTAGLRGVVGAGPGRMNCALLRRVTRALAEVLVPAGPLRDPVRPIVVGADARPSSARFLREVVGVLAAYGVPIRFFPDPIATPLVAFAARELQAAAAMVITASHNPAEYNGLKVYGSDGVQLAAPWDSLIEQRMAELPRASEIPAHPDPMQGADAAVQPIDSRLVDEYFNQLALIFPGEDGPSDLPIVYTPLHGVGWAATGRALREGGFTCVLPVPEQVLPDGEFPTARSPNPEQPATLELALELGSKLGARLVLANDPDADRLAACVRDIHGDWKILTGNQLGLLLADFLLERSLWPQPGEPKPLLVQSVVSSPMLQLLAAEHGARWERTLTGFKWIWAAVLELERTEGVRFGFAYEQALGYSVTPLVRDKDGISAALAFARLAARQEKQQRSVVLRLAELYQRFGLWVSAEHSVALDGPGAALHVERALARLVQSPPTELGRWRLDGVTDYRHGQAERPRWCPASPLVELLVRQCATGPTGRLLVRPSGTEPKLKIYADLSIWPLPADRDVWQLEQELLAEAQCSAVQLGNWLFSS